MPGPSPVNSACLDDGQEPTGCCKFPPNISVGLEYVSARQDCSPTCGDTPCTSTDAVYDEDGNCIAAEQVCSPNWEALTQAEKCAAKRYLKVTTVDRSGGATHGRTQIKQYTLGADGEYPICTLTTSCSGSHTPTITFSDYCSGSTSCTTTYNEDCSTTIGNGSGSIQADVGGGLCCVSSVNSDCTDEGELYLCADGPTGEPNFEGSCGDFQCPGEVTSSPAVSCLITTTYTNEATTGACTPTIFPSYPAFIDCTLEGEEPPESPELTVGQGYDEQAFRYVNPTNPTSKTEQKIRFRVKHTPTGTCYLKVWFRKVIQNWKYEDCETGFEGDPPRTESWEAVVNCEDNPCTSRWSTDGAPTFEAAGTYEWQGTGYPCFSDDAKPPSYCVNAIYSSEPVTVAATGNQSIFIEFKYSQLEGYEPNWGDENGYQGCNPNGFPIPNPADCP
jgi:hypothetical protein